MGTQKWGSMPICLPVGPSEYACGCHSEKPPATHTQRGAAGRWTADLSKTAPSLQLQEWVKLQHSGSASALKLRSCSSQGLPWQSLSMSGALGPDHFLTLGRDSSRSQASLSSSDCWVNFLTFALDAELFLPIPLLPPLIFHRHDEWCVGMWLTKGPDL